VGVAKSELRSRLRSRCAALSDPQRLDLSKQIATHLNRLPGFSQINNVALFSGAAALGEVDTEAVFLLLQQAGMTVSYPRVHSEGQMMLHRVHCPADLQRGYRDLLEPAASQPRIAAADVDLLLVPGLGFGPNGERLGRGGGFYDRLLAQAASKAVVLGLAFDFQRVAGIPMQPHDRYVNGVATERGLVLYPPRF
jgi:5-formyltetrahydrofolate cyclo-ligase